MPLAGPALLKDHDMVPALLEEQLAPLPQAAQVSLAESPKHSGSWGKTKMLSALAKLARHAVSFIGILLLPQALQHKLAAAELLIGAAARKSQVTCIPPPRKAARQV